MSIGYLISEGFKSLTKQKKMTSASTIIMVATMFMFGIFFVIGENVRFVMDQVVSQQGIKVIIKEGITEQQKDKLENEIRAIEGTNKVTYTSKEQALSSVKEILGNNQYLISGWDENNPFPASFFVTLNDLSENERVQQEIYKLDNVDEINSKNDTMSKLESMAGAINIITMVLLVLLVAISIFIISYTIKLTVHARRKEISIMKYVGATNNFIRGPFIIEGIIIGIISALISIIILGLVYNVVTGKILSTSVMYMTLQLYTFVQLFTKVLIVYLTLGIGIGILGSTISMRKYLEV